MDSKNIVQLCPNCQTGADSLVLDDKEPICPYIHLHNGQSCVMFKQLKNKTSISGSYVA